MLVLVLVHVHLHVHVHVHVLSFKDLVSELDADAYCHACASLPVACGLRGHFIYVRRFL